MFSKRNIKSVHYSFLTRTSLLDVLFDYIVNGIIAHHLYYEEILEIILTNFANEPKLQWPPRRRISLISALFNHIIKIMKLLHNVAEASIMLFGTYHPNYKGKIGDDKIFS